MWERWNRQFPISLGLRESAPSWRNTGEGRNATGRHLGERGDGGSSGRAGAELRRAWEAMRGEAEQGAEWLGRELEGPLAIQVESAGDGSTTGATRGTAETRRLLAIAKIL